MLSVFVETNPIGVVLEEEVEMKLRYLSSILTTSRTSGKSNSTSRVCFFDEGDGNRSAILWRPS